MPGFHCTRWRFPVRYRVWLPTACNLENRNTFFRGLDGKMWLLHRFAVFVRGPISRFGGMFLCPMECLPRGGSCWANWGKVLRTCSPLYSGCPPNTRSLAPRTREVLFGLRILPRKHAMCHIPGKVLPGDEYRISPGSDYGEPERESTGNNPWGRQLAARVPWLLFPWLKVLHVIQFRVYTVLCQ